MSQEAISYDMKNAASGMESLGSSCQTRHFCFERNCLIGFAL